MTPPAACWIVQDDDERWLAERTLRALGERGIVARIARAAALADAVDATQPAWLLRAGAMPDRLPALPSPAPGRNTIYLGVEIDETGALAPGWQSLLDAHGGRHGPHAPDLPRWVVVHAEQPTALLQALRRGEALQDALAAAWRTSRAVVASGIRARWSGDVRVGLLIGTLHRGGAEQVTLDLASRLPAQGVATQLVTCFEPKRDALPPPPGAVCLHHRVDARGDVVAQADRVFKRWGADLVHAHLVEARVLRRLTALGHRVATTAHNARAGWPAGHDALTREDVALVLGCAVGVTRALHDALDTRAAPPVIRTAWNGIARPRAPAPGTRASVRRELGIADDAMVLVSVANDRPQKRLHLLPAILDALAVTMPDAACIQVGNRPDDRLPETLHAHAHAQAPRDHPRLHFVGASDDVGRWLAAADVFVSTSAHEGLSLAQLEALAAGLPVVATAVGGHEELARFAAGYVALAPDASPGEFAAAIVDAASRSTSGHVDALSDRRMAARHAALYRDTVRARPGGDGVLVISNNQNVGGAQSSARRFALALHAQGRRVGVAVLFETDDALSDGSREIVRAGVPLFAPSAAQRTNARTLAAGVAASVRDFAPSTVIFWNANVEMKIRLADAMRDVAVFDVSPGEMYFAELARYFAKPASDLPYLEARDYGALLSGVVVKYEDERAPARHLLGRPVHVVPNGLAIPARPQPAPGARGAVVGTLARINPDKKLEQLIAAFELASAQRPELGLLIGGAPDKGHADYADGLRRASAHLRIRWLGHLDAAALFERIALFVLVAEPAGCPNASLEAMAAGLPVLATRVGGMSEQVIDNETGWLTPRGDPQALATRLVDALADPARLSACGERAHRRAAAMFSVERMVSGYLLAAGLTASPPPLDTPDRSSKDSMAYDSDASWDSGALDIDIGGPSGDTAAAPDNAASAVLAAASATAMAASVMQDDLRGSGWDAPLPAVFATPHSVTTRTGLVFDDDDGDDSPSRNGGTGRRADPALSAQARALQEIALRAYTLHPDFCHQSTAEVADHYGHGEIDGASANAQVAQLESASTWRRVNGAQAAALAERGVLVIAGLGGAGKAGHTAIVVPGTPATADRQAYPRVCGGGLPMRRSDGSKTAADAWTEAERAKVRYFTPETRSWLRRVVTTLFGL